MALAIAVAVAALGALPGSSRAAGPCDAPVVNPIACENSKPGTPPSDWGVTRTGDPSIQGFATSMSVDEGGTISFKVKTDAPSYHIDILRLGYYGGDGARKIVSNLPLATQQPQSQPDCLTDSSTGLIDCGNWSVSASWQVPADAVSGVYIAHLVRDDTGGDSQIPFVVRDDGSHSAMLVQTSDETWEAYNAYGGNSLYGCSVSCPPGNPKAYRPAYAVSYNRPFDGSFSTDGGRSYLFYAEYQMIRFMEENGYDVSYTSQADVERNPALLLNHKVFVASGHDEYWTGGERAAVESARDSGVNLAFFTGNEVFWKTRWANSTDGSNSPYRTLITYKETHFDAPADPADPTTWTGSWIDPRFSPPADGGRPPNALTGQLFLENSGTSDIQVPARYSKLRFWRNTPVASLTGSQTLTLAPGSGTLGYEWDEDVDNGFRPAGLFDLSSTTVSGVERFLDYGTTTDKNSTGTHNLTLYRAASGALVFGAGTVQWAWGLDDSNVWGSTTTEPSRNPPDPTMQQATVNLFADMGAQPATLLPGLVPATASTDTLAPTSSISSPADGANVQDGDRVTISGTAADIGGVVAGVEVSTDGGKTWHPANGTANWTYSWDAHGSPSTTIESRAVDDSGNIETPSDAVKLSVGCPCSLWGSTVTPDVPDAGDGNAVELGVKFRSDTFGQITGIRFYKSAANTGTHVGSLWTADGQRLAQATFTNESASGWESVDFATPVAVQPNTTYVASYYAPAGHFAASQYYFNTPPPTSGNQIDSAPLHAVPASAGTTNGLYAYGRSSSFPTNSFDSSNYWVDVKFTPAAKPGLVTGVSATGGTAQASVSWSAPAGGAPVTTYTVTPYIGSTAQPATKVSGDNPPTSTTIRNLTPGTAYTFTVTASNPNGSGGESAHSNAVTPIAPTAPSPPTGVVARTGSCTVQVSWSAPGDDGGSAITGYTVTPSTGGNSLAPVDVGPDTTSTVINGLRLGTHYTFTVTATNAIGTSSASAASNAAAPADTVLDFTQPATANTADSSSVELGVRFNTDTFGLITGIRFYKSSANTGTHVGALWSADGTLLASATFTNESDSGWQQVEFDRPVIVTAGATYVAGYLAPHGHYSSTTGAFTSAVDSPPLHALADSTSPNGLYAYAGKTTFPVNSVSATSYSVDVMFTPSSSPGQVTGVSATASAGAAKVSWSAPGDGGPVTSYTVTPYVGATADTADAVTLNGSPPDTSTVVRGLPGDIAYTFRVQASNPNGSGPQSDPSGSVTPTAATAPGSPTAVTARAGAGSAQVTWTAPANDGGRAISGYTITPYAGATALPTVHADSSATSTVVNGLTNGTSYTFTVTASNTVGAGTASSPSNAIAPADTLLDFGTPATSDSGDGSSTVVGVKFSSDVFGTVTGLRFYKAAANVGTHVGSLWTADGTLLATATFTNESGTGWQQVDLPNPVSIAPGTTYVAAYLAPRGHYSNTTPAFSPLGLDNAPLHAPADSSTTNGVYAYSSTSVLPSKGFSASNYWVDVLFKPAAAAGAVANVKATAGPTRAKVTWDAPTSGGPVTKYVVTPYIGSTAQTPTTVTGSPPDTSATIQGLTAGTSYTFTVQAVNPAGSGPVSGQSNAVTPTAVTAPDAPGGVVARSATGVAQVGWTAPADGGSPITGYTVTPFTGGTAQTPVQVDAGARSTIVSGLTNGTGYTFQVTATNATGTGQAATSSAATPRNTIFDFATPTQVDSGDPGSVEVGVKFQSDVAGKITGLRFYKAPTNAGNHVASVWSATGTLLGSTTFSGESASGWQQVDFPTPISIAANTTYVAGYLAPSGHYSATTPAFSPAGVDNGPLHALANGVSPNGVYTYTRTSTFPTHTSNAANYWVDVLFAPGS